MRSFSGLKENVSDFLSEILFFAFAIRLQTHMPKRAICDSKVKLNIELPSIRQDILTRIMMVVKFKNIKLLLSEFQTLAPVHKAFSISDDFENELLFPY